jgi:hypothetical protein
LNHAQRHRAGKRRTLTDNTRLRRRVAVAAERIIAALDALDAPQMDREDDDPAEDGADEEPSLGWPEQGKIGVYHYNSGDDIEEDPAELGIADGGGLCEQTVGEPSLGATLDIDQRIAWLKPEGFLEDAEATGTEDDIRS